MRRSADHEGFATVLAILLLALTGSPAAAAPSDANKPRSPEQRRRHELLEQVGLDKQPKAEPAKPEAPVTGVPPREPPPEREVPATGPPGAAAPPPPPSFRGEILPLLEKGCKACHAAGAVAQATPFVLSGKVGPDHRNVLAAVDLRVPAASALLTKASGGKPHAGGAPWPARGAAYRRILAWIKAGAPLDDANAASRAVPLTPPLPPRALARSATRPPTAAASNTDIAPEPPGATDAPVPSAPAQESSGNEVPRVDFAGAVRPLLLRHCSTCHGPSGPAASTRFVLGADVAGDEVNVRTFIDPAAPAQSALLTKGAGQSHGGGVALATGSPGYAVLLSWIAAGDTPTGTPAAETAGIDTAETPRPAASAAAPAPARPMNHPRGGGDGPALPYGLALNGRFDLAYERQGVASNPFAGSATNALRSYHHFLFLSRESSGDPIAFSVEMLSLQFWEARYRWRASHRPVQVTVAAGKILVPFGAEPLTHQSYGGLAGFDQRVLPVVWAREGLAVHLVVHRRELSFTDDLFVVRGYALRQASGVINLQNDFASEDAARLGVGNRLGASWGPFGVWYSAYYNPLGYGRRLFMQAADVMLWRMRQVPVLGHFSLAAGLMRADVSGGEAQEGGDNNGGAGRDYYHFASYLQVRYHPTDWLFVQYRQGLRTFNNRRGVILDESRLTSDDASTHNFGVVARHRGLSGGLYYFVNLEKADEIPNDFLRASLSYDF